MKPLEKPDFEIHETHLEFKGLGDCGSGSNMYGFQLVFYEPADTQHCNVRFLEQEVEFRIKKALPGKWPRLQSDQTKPHWIKVDFDHFEVSDSEDEKDNSDIKTPEMEELEKKLMEDVEKYDSIVNVLSYIKTGYLVLYNLIQWAGFTILIGILFYVLLKDGSAGITKAYERGFPVIAVFQLLACMEIVNNLLGLVKGGVGPSILQNSGRLFILFACLYPVESIHTHPVVFCLFMVYGLIEIVRYPFYVTSALNMNVSWLTWLRYSMWIPLYPLGFTCEAITMWLSLQHGQPGGVWSYPLSNPLNISVSVAGLQKLTLMSMPLAFYALYSHMASQRRRKLSTKEKKP